MAQAQRKVVDFKTLLNIAHGKGLENIVTEPITISKDFAFFSATVTMTGGRVFQGHADATPQNVGPGMAPSFIRMAETRAIVRALRLAVNIGEVGVEELHDYDGQNSATQRSSAGGGLGPINDSGAQCPHKECNAPAGRPHGTKCPITLAPAPAGV